MLIFVIAGFLTLFLGPFMFAFLSKYSHKYRYPVGFADSIGDGIFLTLFNAYTFSFGMLNYMTYNTAITITSLSASIIFGAIIMVWRKNYSNFNDWSRPVKGTFNFGGYYHSIFLTVQSFIILFSLIMFNSIMLYILFSCYVITFILHELYIKKKLSLPES
jgi:hypothetical protein